jgi:hypothetical protein
VVVETRVVLVDTPGVPPVIDVGIMIVMPAVVAACLVNVTVRVETTVDLVDVLVGAVDVTDLVVVRDTVIVDVVNCPDDNLVKVLDVYVSVLVGAMTEIVEVETAMRVEVDLGNSGGTCRRGCHRRGA